MTKRRLRLATISAVAALLMTPAIGSAAQAAPADRTPPATPFIGYSQGFFCFTLYIGVSRVSDNVTPEPLLRYEAFADGRFLGVMDRGNAYSAWGNLKLQREGRIPVYVEVVDQAGNRSRSSTNWVIGYDCEL